MMLSVAIKTVSEINSTEHWTKKSKRRKQQQFFVRQALLKENTAIHTPCTIKLSRHAPRLLDDDNLRSSFKYIRDEIASYIYPEKIAYSCIKGSISANKGFCDSGDQITWMYAQIKDKRCFVTIEIINS